MSESGTLAERLAEAVADGTSVDWAAVTARCDDGRARALVANLQALAGLADACDPTATRGDTHVARTPAPAAGWMRALRAVAGVQVVLGWMGFAFGVADARRIPAALPLLAGLACAAAALVLVRSGRRDPRAVQLGTLFLIMAAACSHRTAAWLTGALPAWTPGLELVRALSPESFLPFVLWSFVREFPRVVALRPLDARMAAAQRLSLICGALFFAAHVAAFLRHPTAPATDPWLGVFTRWHASQAFWAVVFGLAAPALVVALRRARDAAPGERRRVTLFLAGLVSGVTPLVTLVLLEAVVPAVRRVMDGPLAERAGTLAVFGGLASVPLTCAYAVAAHRVLDLQLAARGLLRHLLVLAAAWVPPAAAATFVAVRLYGLRRESLAQIVGGAQGPTLALAALAAALMLHGRDVPAQAVLRALRGGRPDWREVMARLGRDLQDAGTARDVCAVLATTISAALQVERVQALPRRDAVFEPAGGGTRGLAADSALATMAEQCDKPVVTDPDEPGSVFRWLPEAERLWVADGDVRVLVPLVAANGSIPALVAVGPRRDGRPLDRDDLLLLTALAAPAALALAGRERETADARVAARQTELPALECTGCARVRPAGTTACDCGAALRPAPIPFVLAGKFQVEATLGRGGMGVVYRARDLELGRAVALKTLPRLNAEAALRLRAEARAMAALVHPHLAFIYGAESWCGVPVLVVEYLAGGTLAARSATPRAIGDVLHMGALLAGALDAMHRQGLLHRDVKPSNVGLTADGVPKLLDFGLARLMAEARGVEADGAPARVGPLTAGAAQATSARLADRSRTAASTSWAGTVLYMPPEALRDGHAGVTQDLWGLTLSLYEALAGRHPLAGCDPDELFEALGAGRLPDLRTLRPDCPPAVAAFFRGALAPAPAARPASAAALRDELLALTRAAAA